MTSGILGMVLCYASKIKFQNRMELLNVKDLTLTEAADMATKYLTLEFSARFLAMLILILLFGTLAFFTDRLVRKDRKAMLRKEKLIFWCIRAGLGLLMVAAFFHYNGRISNWMSQGDDSHRMYFLSERPTDFVVYHFLERDTTSYSADEVKEIYETVLDPLVEQYNEGHKDTALSPDQYPNVIVVMNESWWHMDRGDENKMKLSHDPLGPVKELGDKVAWGSAVANVFGGGTISSETEFLTGWNGKYFRNSISVVDDREIHSLVEYFNDLGYNTRAIHPFLGSFYNREVIYRYMGFDHVTFDPDMIYRELFDRYINDDSLADQIIYEFENREEDKAFIFAVSVATHSTHMGYSIPFNENYPYKVSIEKGKDWSPIEDWSEADFASFKRTVNGIYEASESFAKLVQYFDNQDEPAILVMFGDHCPNLSVQHLSDVGILKASIDAEWIPTAIRPDSSEETIRDTLLLYTVPVVSWSNCLEDADMNMSDSNLGVLGSRIIQKANLPVSKMVLLENYYETQLATDHSLFMLDQEHNFVYQTTEEISESIRIKSLIQYDLMYGDGICEDVWIPLQ